MDHQATWPRIPVRNGPSLRVISELRGKQTGLVTSTAGTPVGLLRKEKLGRWDSIAASISTATIGIHMERTRQAADTCRGGFTQRVSSGSASVRSPICERKRMTSILVILRTEAK